MSTLDVSLAEDYSYALKYLADEDYAGKNMPANTFSDPVHHAPDSSPFPLMHLPTELILEIIKFLGPPDLANMLRVNRTVQLIAETELYKNPEPTPLRVIPCLKMLVTHSNLSSITRRLVLCDLTRNFDMCGSYLSLLSRALHSMPALKDLILLLDGPYAKYLHGCPFRLHSLRTTLTWDLDLVKWMDEQYELSDAMFGGPFVKGTVLLPNALGKISQISATPLILAAVVPGRPVRGVEISLLQPELMDDDIVWTTFRILSFSTGPVSSVQMIADVSNPIKVLSVLNAIPKCMSRLDSFALYGGRGTFTLDLAGSLTTFVSGFQYLRSITLISRTPDGALLDQTTLRGLVGTLHASCPTLECISFIGSVWVFDSQHGWVALANLEHMFHEGVAIERATGP